MKIFVYFCRSTDKFSACRTHVLWGTKNETGKHPKFKTLAIRYEVFACGARANLAMQRPVRRRMFHECNFARV